MTQKTYSKVPAEYYKMNNDKWSDPAMKTAPKIILTALLGCAMLLSACSLPKSYRKADRDVLKDAGKSGRYAWRIGITAIENDTEYQDPMLAKAIYQSLSRTLRKKCSTVLLVGHDDPKAPNFLNTPPRKPNGHPDNFALAAAARNKGLNAVLVSKITGIQVEKELTGFYRFKKTKHYLRIQFISDLYDSATGAKLSSEEITTDIEVDKEDGKAITNKTKAAAPLLAEAMKSIGSRNGKSTCAALNSAQWLTSVLKASPEGITISAGSDVGMKPNDRLIAYEGGRVMNGKDGERFIVPGYKIGEIKIIKVSPHRSEAKIISDGPIPAGSLLTP